MTIASSLAASQALLVQCAADMFTSDPTNRTPKPDPRLLPDWRVVGYIVARDAVFRRGPLALGFVVNYGFLAQSTADVSKYIAVVRGTASLVEWIEDALFESVPHPQGFGRVEAGFYSVYESMQYLAVGEPPRAAAAGIWDAIGTTGTVTVIGHSLGAALATYLAFDLTGFAGERVRATLLASPQCGNAEFVHAFDTAVKDYTLINRVVDIVPHVPFGPEYDHLPGCLWLWPKDEQARICFGIACQHHVLIYSSVLDFASAKWSLFPPLDKDMISCIKGPLTTLAARL